MRVIERILENHLEMIVREPKRGKYADFLLDWYVRYLAYAKIKGFNWIYKMRKYKLRSALGFKGGYYAKNKEI